MKIQSASFAAILFLAACSKSPEPAAQKAPAAPAVASTEAPVKAATPAPAKPLLLTSTPATVRVCEISKNRTAVTLNWDVRSTGAKAVTIKVGERLFIKAGPRGTGVTGDWVHKSSVFTLSDAATNAVLATLQIPFVDC